MKLLPRLRRAVSLIQSVRRNPKRDGLRVAFVEPCYWVIDRLTAESVILDFGLGTDADFSAAMIGRFGLTAHGFDPTKRHEPELRRVETEMSGRLHVHLAAVGRTPGRATFYESQQNVSGSMKQDHPNIVHDEVVKYDVDVLTVDDAISRAGGSVAAIKMDIEGSEYDVLDAIPPKTLQSVDQWIIEFHHDMPGNGGFARTRQNVRRFGELGFHVYTRDGVNFLFYRVK